MFGRIAWAIIALLGLILLINSSNFFSHIHLSFQKILKLNGISSSNTLSLGRKLKSFDADDNLKGKMIIMLRNPVEASFDAFLEECSNGRIGVKCAPGTQMCSVDECTTSKFGHSTCSSNIPAPYNKLGGVCNPQGYADFLFKTNAKGTFAKKKSSRARSRVLSHLYLLHNLKSWTMDHPDTEAYITSSTILLKSDFIKELNKINSFISKDDVSIEVPSTEEQVLDFNKGLQQQKLSSLNTISVDQLSDQMSKVISNTGTKNLRSRRVSHHTATQSRKIKLTLMVESHLEQIFCNNNEHLLDFIAEHQLLHSGESYSNIFEDFPSCIFS